MKIARGVLIAISTSILYLVEPSGIPLGPASAVRTRYIRLPPGDVAEQSGRCSAACKFERR